MSGVLDKARYELDNLQPILDANDPYAIAEKAVQLSALLSSVNVQVAKARQANAEHFGTLLKTTSATASKELAKSHQTYLTYMAAQGISDSLKETSYGLRKLAEIAAAEKQLTK